MRNGNIQLQGSKELEKKLRTLGNRVFRKVMRSAVNAAATPIVKAAKSEVEVDSGLLKKSLGKKVSTNKRTMQIAGVVGARTNVQGEVNGEVRKPSRYAHLVEKGHIDKHGNHVPPHPFLRPAADEAGPQAMEVLQTQLAKGIAKEALKAAAS